LLEKELELIEKEIENLKNDKSVSGKALLKAKKQQFKAYQPLPYQKIKRDLAFLVTEEVIVGDIIKSIKNLKENILL
jgi:phenylalanyl-tRNA synthetase beta subunit